MGCFEFPISFALRLLNVRISASRGGALQCIVLSGSLRQEFTSQRACPPPAEHLGIRRGAQWLEVHYVDVLLRHAGSREAAVRDE